MPPSVRDLRKAAILMVSIGDESASRILRLLDETTSKKISQEIRQLGDIKADERNVAIAEFLTELLQGDDQAAASIVRRWSNPSPAVQFPRFRVN